MTTREELAEQRAIARRQQRRDSALESLGLLTYQNPTLTATQLNAATQAAIASGALNLSGASTGSGGGGGGSTPARITSAPSAPSTTPSTAPGTSAPPLPGTTPTPSGGTLAGGIFPTTDPFRTIAETIMPYFSPEDQRLMADLYGFAQTGEDIPGQVDAGQRNNYLSQGRAEEALTALGNLNPEIQTSGGSGYQFLVNALNILRDFGGEGGQMDRQNYLRFDLATRRLMEEAGGGNLGQYRDLVNMFSFPTFSAGPLVDVRNAGGVPVFGSANRRLFT